RETLELVPAAHEAEGTERETAPRVGHVGTEADVAGSGSDEEQQMVGGGDAFERSSRRNAHVLEAVPAPESPRFAQEPIPRAERMRFAIDDRLDPPSARGSGLAHTASAFRERGRTRD